MKYVNVIGAGLAGSECALQLAKRGIKVNLYEMRPKTTTGAHVSDKFAEFVCSNSLGSYDITNASGLLKKEMELLGGELIKIAYECQVPAGGALAIDRELFSDKVTQKITQNKNINIIREEITEIPDTPTVIATGPLTSSDFAEAIKEFTENEYLYFFDAIAPIVEKDSINFDIAFYANRYGKDDMPPTPTLPLKWGGSLGENSQTEKTIISDKDFSFPPPHLRGRVGVGGKSGFNSCNVLSSYSMAEDKKASYINCPMDKEQYERFYNILINAPKIELKEFERDAKFFESCLPIEVLASRGVDTLRYGPMKPVGLIDKRTGRENYAVVQLRQDNSAKTLYNLVGFQTNLKWGAQKELLQSIPGLENVNIVRYGVMHRNTFINSPKVLNATLQSRKRPDLFFAGQITGTEGYTESIATGLLAGINMARYLTQVGGQVCPPYLKLPKETMLGALTQYISDPKHEKFQPINSNWGIVTPIELPKKERKNKKLKNEKLAKRSFETLENILENSEFILHT